MKNRPHREDPHHTKWNELQMHEHVHERKCIIFSFKVSGYHATTQHLLMGKMLRVVR